MNAIAQLIAAQGPLTIAQFMTQALLDPKSGYYATRDPFGANGDFITAPEVSQMFGELLGLWIVKCWLDQGEPKNVQLMELGPGRGTLMADALRAARLVPQFLKAIDVVLVEASPTLQAIQQEQLKDAGVPVRWATHFEADNRPLFLLANEFFDALPIRQFVKTPRGWCERMVALDERGRLAFALAPIVSEIDIPASRGNAEEGAVYEISPASTALTEEIAHAIAKHGGAALIVDYGHDGTGFGDTLQAVTQHKYANILEVPGDADLSAHVDFGALAEAARRGGAVSYGPVEQGEFLTSLGIIQRAENLCAGQAIGYRRNSGTLSRSPEIQQQLERLILPDQMGTLFKALAIMPNGASRPPGF